MRKPDVCLYIYISNAHPYMNLCIRDGFIASSTRSIKLPMDTRHFGIPKSRLSNNVVCLLTFTSYHQDKIRYFVTMTLRAEIWRLGCSETSVTI